MASSLETPCINEKNCSRHVSQNAWCFNAIIYIILSKYIRYSIIVNLRRILIIITCVWSYKNIFNFSIISDSNLLLVSYNDRTTQISVNVYRKKTYLSINDSTLSFVIRFLVYFGKLRSFEIINNRNKHKFNSIMPFNED